MIGALALTDWLAQRCKRLTKPSFAAGVALQWRMHAIRRRMRACTWLALVAVAAVAIGPTVSRLALPELAAPAAMNHAAMHHARMQVAAVAGDVVAMDDGATKIAREAHHRHLPAAPANASLPARPAHSHGLEHCALCVVALFAFAVAPPPPRVSMPSDGLIVVAARRGVGVAHCRDTWSPIGSRGPPTLG